MINRNFNIYNDTNNIIDTDTNTLINNFESMVSSYRECLEKSYECGTSCQRIRYRSY